MIYKAALGGRGARSVGPLSFKELRSLVIPCARATRGRGLPSLDARTTGTNQAVLAEDENEVSRWHISLRQALIHQKA